MEREARAADDGVDARRRGRGPHRARRDGGHRAEAEDDRLAVRQAIAALDLERVPERVAEVERPPLAALERVALDDPELELDGTVDEA